MLMTIVEHLPGGDRVGENVDEDVDVDVDEDVEHLPGGDRVRAPPAWSWQQPAGSPRDVRTEIRINLTIWR